MRQPYPKDYATHIPILVGLGLSGIRFESILEYGAGLYSTPLFLNREAFPYVKEVTSCENNEEWVGRVVCETSAGNDDRLVWYKGFDEVADATYDLVFIDADTEPHKIDLIQKTRETFPGVVVIHDSEVPSYQAEIRQFKTWHDYGIWEPNTAVIPGRDPLTHLTSHIHEILIQNDHLDPDNVDGWIDVFRKIYGEMYAPSGS